MVLLANRRLELFEVPAGPGNRVSPEAVQDESVGAQSEKDTRLSFSFRFSLANWVFHVEILMTGSIATKFKGSP